MSDYVTGARNRIVARKQTLVELGFSYVLVAVVISTIQKMHPYLLAASIVVYSAFGYMIWTVLENAADANEGSGFRLMSAPTRWRRNGLAFVHGLRVIVLSVIFAFIWIPGLMVVITLITGGSFHLSLVEYAHTRVPVLRPWWSGLFVFPALIIPVVLVHARLMRRAKGPLPKGRKTRLGDRALWSATMMVLVFLFIEARETLIRLPFPAGAGLAATFAILLTITTAAIELSFREQTQRAAEEK